jgi:hypothetical protein
MGFQIGSAPRFHYQLFEFSAVGRNEMATRSQFRNLLDMSSIMSLLESPGPKIRLDESLPQSAERERNGNLTLLAEGATGATTTPGTALWMVHSYTLNA